MGSPSPGLGLVVSKPFISGFLALGPSPLSVRIFPRRLRHSPNHYHRGSLWWTLHQGSWALWAGKIGGRGPGKHRACSMGAAGQHLSPRPHHPPDPNLLPAPLARSPRACPALTQHSLQKLLLGQAVVAAVQGSAQGTLLAPLLPLQQQSCAGTLNSLPVPAPVSLVLFFLKPLERGDVTHHHLSRHKSRAELARRAGWWKLRLWSVSNARRGIRSPYRPWPNAGVAGSLLECTNVTAHRTTGS